VFVTSQGTPSGRFTRAIKNRNLLGAELAALELEQLPLDDALQLVYLYADARSPKYDRAAVRYLERYLAEESPRLIDVALMAVRLVEARLVKE
jgi:hypothetical protein